MVELDDTLTFEEMRNRLVTLLHPEFEVDNVLSSILKTHKDPDSDLAKLYPSLPKTASQFYLIAVSVLAQRRQEHPNDTLGSWVVGYPYREGTRRARFFFKSDIRVMRILGLLQT